MEKSRRMNARFAEIGIEQIAGSPTEFAKLIEACAEKWRTVIRAANVRL
jgi:hypothetical protein